MNAATMEPPEVPETTCGNRPSSSKTLITPKWYIANAPPPLRQSAVRPNERCASLTNRSVSETSNAGGGDGGNRAGTPPLGTPRVLNAPR